MVQFPKTEKYIVSLKHRNLHREEDLSVKKAVRRCLTFFCAVIIIACCGLVVGKITAHAVDTGEKYTREKTASNEGTDGESDGGELVIVEIHDTETPLAETVLEEEEPNYPFYLVLTISVAGVFLLVIVFLLSRYNKLKIQKKNLEDQIAELYTDSLRANADIRDAGR